jgi:acyl-CoA synthetase (AMP-forming)/AMP-acid ligase II
VRVHELIAEQVQRDPGAIAVAYGSDQMSYGELEATANTVAVRLRRAGLAPGDLVALCTGAGIDAPAAALGVLKAQGVLVPLDPDRPEPELVGLLADCDPSLVLTYERHRVRVAARTPERRILCLDTPDDLEPVDYQDSEDGDDQLAAVLYTSGSHNGAMLEHRQLVAAYRGWSTVLALTPADRQLSTATREASGFAAVWLRALCSGGTLVLSAAGTLDLQARVADLYQSVVAGGVTILTSDIGTVGRLIAYARERSSTLGQVRLLCVTGDRCYLDQVHDIRAFLGTRVRVLNVYGVAEAVGENTYFEESMLSRPVVRPYEVSLMGQPFPGTRVEIVQRSGRTASTGDTGEIAIGGATLGRGYLRRGALAARFRGDGDARMFRTGDLGASRADGVIEYVGRADLPGMSISPVDVAKVEAVLRGHPTVDECVVGTDPATGPQALFAYVVPQANTRVDADDLRAYASARLAAGLIPKGVATVDALPRTRAGRVDRSQLPKLAPPGWARSSPAGGKAGVRRDPGASGPRAFGWVVLTVLGTAAALVLTNTFWPGSTDLSEVPGPWSTMFAILYVCEALSFGLGVAFLFLSGRLISGAGRGWVRRVAGRLAITWLLVAWWPQDNLYRLASKTDWPRQALLVYLFNVSLMVAAVVVVWFIRVPSSAVRDLGEREASGPRTSG